MSFWGLDAKGLRHCHYQRVALRRTDHRQPNTSVAAGSLHHGLPQLQLPGALCLVNYAKGEPVLNRAQRLNASTTSGGPADGSPPPEYCRQLL
jgi:hypothetical protein